ncbi:hypothetical protein [Aquabacterium sp.]|uniref:hypothetical protein n=1 Tax=Aquabacterium sp. TaxID=1872578 RepID=UPI002487353C|nr:hypothetical protein [Aquabacterium sp.]MDI1260282.1 hypothetical protein [Aquabacterium sp.]
MTENPYSPPLADVQLKPAEPVVPDKVLKKIKNAVFAGLLSAAVTLVFTVIAMNGTSLAGFTPWQMIDVVLILGLTFGIHRRSRVCAVAMLGYFIVSKIVIVAETGKFSGGFLSVVFLYYYAQGAIGTFEYQKLRKAQAS